MSSKQFDAGQRDFIIEAGTDLNLRIAKAPNVY